MQDIENIMINDMRELILRIMIGSEDGYTRNEIMEILKEFTNTNYPRTTVYDNIYPFIFHGIIGKKQIPNPKGKGRPIVKFIIINKAKANRLMQYIKNHSCIAKDIGKKQKRYDI